MAGFDQYIQSAAANKQSDTERWARESKLLFEALPNGAAKAVADATQNPDTFGKCVASAAVGFVTSRAWESQSFAGIAARGFGAGIGALAIADMMGAKRLDAVKGTIEGVWSDPGYYDQNKEAIAKGFGGLVADGIIATAGGIAGARLGAVGMRYRPEIPVEWPRNITGEISHRLSADVEYQSTARGAMLKLPHGHVYQWYEHRPAFETNVSNAGGTTMFSDGSKLTMTNDGKVDFRGVGLSKKDAAVVFEADLVNDVHMYESKRPGGPTYRNYSLGKGALIEEHRAGWELFHPSGRGESFKNPTEKLGPAAKIEILPEGARRIRFSNHTQFSVDKVGNVFSEGIRQTNIPVETRPFAVQTATRPNVPDVGSRPSVPAENTKRAFGETVKPVKAEPLREQPTMKDLADEIAGVKRAETERR